MAKSTVAQVAFSFQDFDVKLREVDYLLIKAFNINHQLIMMVRDHYNPLHDDDQNNALSSQPNNAQRS